MKQLSKTMLFALGFGLMAVSVISIPSRPLRADDRRDSQNSAVPTYFGISPRNLVVLDCIAFSNGTCTQYNQVGRDGTVKIYGGPPRGSDLMITDVSWQSFGNSPGQLEGVTLLNLGGTLHLFANDATAEANGDATGNIHFAAGIIYAGVPNIVVNSNDPQLQVIGYNVSDY